MGCSMAGDCPDQEKQLPTFVVYTQAITTILGVIRDGSININIQYRIYSVEPKCNVLVTLNKSREEPTVRLLTPLVQA